MTIEEYCVKTKGLSLRDYLGTFLVKDNPGVEIAKESINLMENYLKEINDNVMLNKTP